MCMHTIAALLHSVLQGRGVRQGGREAGVLDVGAVLGDDGRARPGEDEHAAHSEPGRWDRGK